MELTDSDAIGLSREQARENLATITPQYMAVMKRLIELAKGASETKVGEKQLLENQRDTLYRAMTENRDWYSLGELEALDKHSGELRWATFALIGLTVVLAIETLLLLWKGGFP
jgi:hypothetical protein